MNSYNHTVAKTMDNNKKLSELVKEQQQRSGSVKYSAQAAVNYVKTVEERNLGSTKK